MRRSLSCSSACISKSIGPLGFLRGKRRGMGTDGNAGHHWVIQVTGWSLRFGILPIVLHLLFFAGCAGPKPGARQENQRATDEAGFLFTGVLVQAAQKGDDETLMKMIKGGTDVNAPMPWAAKGGGRGYSALYAAAEKGHTSTVRLLLENGARPGTSPGPGSCCPGWTPLMIAAAERHAPTVAMLLNAGADPDAQNRLGPTAPMFAASYDEVEIVQALLDHAAKLDTVPTDGMGLTALMAAVRGGHLEVVTLLLDRGVNTAIKDACGTAALGWAKQRGVSTIVRLLEARGAET
jgi:uncharacterized protein